MGGADAAAFATIRGVLYGCNQGMFSGVLAMPVFQSQGRLTSVLELGAWLGALLSGFLAEAISRKYGILVATIVFVTGVVIQATAITAGYQAILAGRFITGIGVGSLSVIVPIYNSECAPPEVRGAFVALQQLSICFGIMISFWTD
ncbi:hypothetical protein EsHS_00007467 [Epichloe bromicola]